MNFRLDRHQINSEWFFPPHYNDLHALPNPQWGVCAKVLERYFDLGGCDRLEAYVGHQPRGYELRPCARPSNPYKKYIQVYANDRWNTVWVDIGLKMVVNRIHGRHGRCYGDLSLVTS